MSTATNRIAKAALERLVSGKTLRMFLLTKNTTAWQTAATLRDMDYMSDVAADENVSTSYARQTLTGLTATESDANDRAELDCADATFPTLDAETFDNCAITASDTTLTTGTSVFIASDVGRQIVIPGAGAAGADLETSIVTYTDASTVEVADAAGTTVSGVTVSVQILGVGVMEMGATDDTDSPLYGVIDVSALGVTPNGSNLIVQIGANGFLHATTV